METHEARRRIDLILSDSSKLEKSALSTFKQFDKDRNGVLDLVEFRQLVNRLVENLKLPPVDEKTLSIIVTRYDIDGPSSSLSPQEFVKLYHDLLTLIRDRHYPVKKIQSRRDLFVGKRKLNSNVAFEDLFTLGKRLGAGSFGEVRLVTDKSNGFTRVCKVVGKDRLDLPAEQIATEIDCMITLDHPNIIKMYEVLEDRHNVYMIMEPCEGGELMEVITKKKRRTERNVATWMHQVLEAITYSHSKNIVHKDLKPENIMFLTSASDSLVKVIDFGVAELFKPHQQFSESIAGTPLYLAPEEFSAGICAKKCDCWAFGCVTYVLLTGRFPFYAKTQAQLKQKILHAEPNYDSECKAISPLAVDMLKKCFIKDARKRPSARELLKHEWFAIAPSATKELSSTICDNLSSYVRQNQAKSALFSFMTYQMPCSNTQMLELQKVFKSLDVEEKGYLSSPKFEKALVDVGMPPHEARKVADTLENPSEPGVIYYTTFLSACFDYRQMSLDMIWSAFTKIDKDGDGVITTKEFAHLLAGDSTNLVAKEEIESFVNKVDSNGNGVIEWEEFKAAMSS